MKLSLFLSSVAVFLSFAARTQDVSPYTFSSVQLVESTKAKDQCNTGTCWSYSTTSFLESEIIRLGKGSHDISEMYNVRMTYPKKAERFVRFQGKAQFGPGSLNHDVINVVRDYGMVPDAVYSGLKNGMSEHDHTEMDAMLEGMLKALIEKRTAGAGNSYLTAVEGVLEAYLGEAPEQFTYNGKSYTPASFRDAMGIKPNDYVSLTSFSHHPFYQSFVLEVPDNFSGGSYWNVTIDELEKTVVDALSKGFSVAWDADVSERGFSFRNGVAILPQADVAREDYFKKIVPEIVVTQVNRQEGFDNYQTTDDHLMHIVGTAKDQNGGLYFVIKNSWGEGNPHQGYQYISSAYFRMKTVGILLHKDAVPSAIKSKLKL
jgi:bleomycin hydrolase